MPAHVKDNDAADLRAELDSRYRGPLSKFFAIRVRNRADVPDLVQETLVRTLGSPAVSRLQHAEAYIFSIASNLLKEYRRKAQRFRSEACIPIDDAIASELESELVEEITPERLLLSRGSLKAVLAMLEELGERTRDIFILSRLENVRQKDIAAAFGISQSTVEKHVMRAMVHLTARHGGRKE